MQGSWALDHGVGGVFPSRGAITAAFHQRRAARRLRFRNAVGRILGISDFNAEITARATSIPTFAHLGRSCQAFCLHCRRAEELDSGSDASDIWVPALPCESCRIAGRSPFVHLRLSRNVYCRCDASGREYLTGGPAATFHDTRMHTSEDIQCATSEAGPVATACAFETLDILTLIFAFGLPYIHEHDPRPVRSPSSGCAALRALPGSLGRRFDKCMDDFASWGDRFADYLPRGAPTPGGVYRGGVACMATFELGSMPTRGAVRRGEDRTSVSDVPVVPLDGTAHDEPSSSTVSGTGSVDSDPSERDRDVRAVSVDSRAESAASPESDDAVQSVATTPSESEVRELSPKMDSAAAEQDLLRCRQLLGSAVAGQPIRAFDLEHPESGRERDILKKILYHEDGTVVTPAGIIIRDRPVLTEGKKVVKQRRKEVRDMEALALFRSETLSLTESCKVKHSIPQGRSLFPYTAKSSWVAACRSRKNELAAAVLRHFPGPAGFNLADVDIVWLREAASELGRGLTLSCDLRDMDYKSLLPKKWGEKRKHATMKKLADHLNSGHRITNLRRFFLKPNEALGKPKPRGIQSVDDGMVGLHAIDAALFEHAMFDQDFLQNRSIKRAGPAACQKRLGKLFRRFNDDIAVSIDFGSWDSTVQNQLRDCIENAALTAFLAGLPGGDSGLVEQAHVDRVKQELRLKSTYLDIIATCFGRESGDRGTSSLNWLTNMLLVGLLNRKLTGDTFASWVAKLKANEADVDFCAEGDDLVLLLRRIYEGYNREEGAERAGVPRRTGSDVAEVIDKLYKDAGLKMEPQTFGGRVVSVFEGMCSPKERVEFVSRVWLQKDGFWWSIPKLSKLIPGLGVTFSKEANLGNLFYTAGLSGRTVSAYLPLVRGIYDNMMTGGRRLGGHKWVGNTWTQMRVQWEVQDRALPGTLEEGVKHLADGLIKQSKDMGLEALSREAVAREYPTLTVQLQEYLEERLKVVRDRDDWWCETAAVLELVSQHI